MGNVRQEAKVKTLYGSSGSLGENTVGKGRQEPRVAVGKGRHEAKMKTL